MRSRDKIAHAPSEKWVRAQHPVLLTFDDGPCETTTPIILKLLAEQQIQAVFFVVGKQLEKRANRSALDRIVSAGHIVGNHSYSHTDLTKLPRQEIELEILKTQVMLQEAGAEERIFRPPFGKFNSLVVQGLQEFGYMGLGWNVDPCDWNPEFHPLLWIENGIQQARAKSQSVILLHDIHETTAAGLGSFILALRSLGCTFPPLFSQGERHPTHLEEPWVHAPGGWKVLRELWLYRPPTF